MLALTSVFLLGGLSPASLPGDAQIVVRGDARCPTAAAVQAALEGMLAAPGGERPLGPDVVDIFANGAVVTARLTGPTGVRIAEKRLPTELACGERARAAAVMVAAWEAHLRASAKQTLPPLAESGVSRTSPPPMPAPTFLPATTAPNVLPVQPKLPDGTAGPAAVIAPAAPALSVPPGVLATAEAAVAPVPTPRRAPVALSQKEDLPVHVTAAVPAAAAVPKTDGAITARANAADAPAAALTLDTGVGIITSIVENQIATGVSIEVAASRRNSPFAVGMSGLAVDTHSTAVGSGQGQWRRFGGILDGRALANWRRVQLHMRAGLALSALVVAGRSFPATSGATLFDAGGVVGLRSLFRLGRLSPWVDATAAAWPSTHHLYVIGSDGSADVAAFELFLGVGVSLALIP